MPVILKEESSHHRKYLSITFQTRVLVTHGLAHLPQCDTILVMSEGEIVEIGTYDELMAKDGKLTEIIKSQNSYSDGNGNMH